MIAMDGELTSSAAILETVHLPGGRKIDLRRAQKPWL